jgi:hypothetical protein
MLSFHYPLLVYFKLKSFESLVHSRVEMVGGRHRVPVGVPENPSLGDAKGNYSKDGLLTGMEVCSANAVGS